MPRISYALDVYAERDSAGEAERKRATELRAQSSRLGALYQRLLYKRTHFGLTHVEQTELLEAIVSYGNTKLEQGEVSRAEDFFRKTVFDLARSLLEKAQEHETQGLLGALLGLPRDFLVELAQKLTEQQLVLLFGLISGSDKAAFLRQLSRPAQLTIWKEVEGSAEALPDTRKRKQGKRGAKDATS